MEVRKECETKPWNAEAMDVEEGTGKIEEKSFHEKLALDTILGLENREREKNIEKWNWYLSLKLSYKVSYKRGIYRPLDLQPKHKME